MPGTISVAVCDDARAVKMFLKHVLEEEGDIAVVSSTSTGAAALEETGDVRPDVLLLDLLLPTSRIPRRSWPSCAAAPRPPGSS
jgi:chemotaxis response regulator CheB